MNVFQEFLIWSKDRPTWQRDALRRLVLNGELADQDVRELADICKGDYGLAAKDDGVPLGGTVMKSSISRRLPGSSLRGSEPRRGCRIKMRWPYAYASPTTWFDRYSERNETADALAKLPCGTSIEPSHTSAGAYGPCGRGTEVLH